MKPSYYCHAQTKPLTTPTDVCDTDWHTAYPRPALRRDDSTCRILSDWSLSCVHTKTAAVTTLGKIRLPFPPEAPLSGIGMTLETGERWRYETTVTVTDADLGGRMLLHLPPTDQMCTVTLSDHVYDALIGFPCPITLDITESVIPGDNVLTVTVCDPLDSDIPYGKQSNKRGGMWYTPTSGMRGMPWLELVPRDYIRELRITPSLDSVTITVTGCETQPKTLTYETENGTETVCFNGNVVTIHITNPTLWTPENPHVYRFTLTCGEDCISSYFALRTIGITAINGQAVLTLNGKPHYFHGLLDQGYYPDGIDLPPTPDGYRRDIEAVKALGFETLRKHIRLDDPYFYYYCDLCGICVFQDFVNNGTYSFLRDTALPTVGVRRGIKRPASARQKQLFCDAADGMVQLLYNHPSVVYYTIFNEGWGQFDPDVMYRRYRTMDATRIWDATSGWFFGKESDVQSEHVG